MKFPPESILMSRAPSGSGCPESSSQAPSNCFLNMRLRLFVTKQVTGQWPVRLQQAKNDAQGTAMTGKVHPSHGISRASMAIAAISTIVEWYDFTLYLYLATILARVFFGGGEASLVTTLAGFAVAYV